MNTATRRIEPLVLSILLALIFIMAARTPIDNDLWWHLRAGETMLTQGKILTTDLFSYTRWGADWINHSWLAEIILAGFFRWGGYLALGGLIASLATLSMLFVYLKMEEPPLLRAFVVVWASIVAALVWSPRPQLFSLVLFSLVAYILYIYRKQQKNLLWLLIPIFILWSNLHAGYTLGLMLIGCIIGGEIFNRIFYFQPGEINNWKPVLTLVLWALLCGIAVLINPNGINTWLIPFKTIQVSALQQYISEWASPDFHMISQQVYLWLLFGALILMSISGERIDGVDLIPFVFFGYLGFIARRNFGPFAIVSAPVLSKQLWSAGHVWWGRLKDWRPDITARFEAILSKQNHWPENRDWIRKALNGCIIIFLALAGFIKLYSVTTPEIVASSMGDTFPVKAVDWIKTNQPNGRLFNSYNWGGYLDWFLPEYPVFLDGRTDLFNDQLIGEWMTIVNARPGWKDLLEKWNVNLILLELDHPVISHLQSAGWRLLYQDKQAVLFGRDRYDPR